MKKIKLLMFAFMVGGLALTSCSDDDGDAPAQQANIEGRWYFAKEGLSAMGNEVLNDWPHTTGCTKDHIELIAEGNVYRDVAYFDGCEEDVDTSTWSRNGNNVTLGAGEGAETYEIAELNDNFMKVQQSETLNGQTVYYITTFTRN